MCKWCRRKNVCGRNCNYLCFKCSRCNNYCSDFQEDVCISLTQAPYVCNSCASKGACRLVKYYYRALPSYHQYRHTLSTSRQGINLTDEELCELDNIVSPLIKQGQTIAHIYQKFSNPLSLEFNYDGIGRTRIFFCNPGASYQKGAIEKIMSLSAMSYLKELLWTTLLNKILT
mgnify:CR=1 FL=1